MKPKQRSAGDKMEPEIMREIVTVETFDIWLRSIGLMGLLVSIVLGLLWARKLKRADRWLLGAITGGLYGLIFPFLYGLWRIYLWRIRIDLDKNFVGLHRVDVLLGNLLLFATAGAVVGFIVRLYANWLKRRLAEGESESP